MIASLLIFTIVTSYVSASETSSSNFNFQNGLSAINPQVPQLTPSTASSNSFFSHSNTSNGEEINPNFDGNKWNKYTDIWSSNTNSLTAKQKHNNSGNSIGGTDNGNAHIYNSSYPLGTPSPHMFQNQVIRSSTPNLSFDSTSSNLYLLIQKKLAADPTVPTGFLDRIVPVNAAIYNPSIAPEEYFNNLRLLQLAFPLLSTPSHRSLNILNIGTGSGIVPVGLTLISQPGDSITSIDESRDILTQARVNIERDGKQFYLGIPGTIFPRLSLQVGSLHHSLPKSKFELIVINRPIPVNVPFPPALRDILSPRGVIIYTEESRSSEGNIIHKFRLDRLDSNGNLITEKIIGL